MELTSGRPGWPSLWTLGGSFRVGVFGDLTFRPSAIFSGIFLLTFETIPGGVHRVAVLSGGVVV